MSMTREEAIEELERLLRHWDDLENDKRCFWGYDKEAVALALSALRPVSREQVEKAWRGEWRDLHGDKLVGIDDVGQDVYRHYHYSVCEKCGKGIAVKLNFCPYCGDAKTDEAVQMVMERLEAMKDG